MEANNSNLQAVAEGVVSGDPKFVQELVSRLLSEQTPPEEIIDFGLLRGMKIVGERFKNGDMFIPEVLRSAAAVSGGLDELGSRFGGLTKTIGKVLIGTVKGDIHDIGKNLVAMILRGNGFQVIDLGVNVSPSTFVEAVREHSSDVVAMSALLTTTLQEMEVTIRELESANLRDSLKVAVGGAVVTQKYADQIGADVYAEDAPRAVEKIKAALGVD